MQSLPFLEISSAIWKKNSRSISKKTDKTPRISKRDSGYSSKQHNVQSSKHVVLLARELSLSLSFWYSLTRSCWPASSSSYWAPGELPGVRVPLFSFFCLFFPLVSCPHDEIYYSPIFTINYLRLVSNVIKEKKELYLTLATTPPSLHKANFFSFVFSGRYPAQKKHSHNFFSSSSVWGTLIGNYPQEDPAKFFYCSWRKVKMFRNYAFFFSCRHATTYCLNTMADFKNNSS